jgi:hypothetical protein
MKRTALLSIVLISLISSIFGQLPVGSWRDHLPYNKVIMVAETPTRIYAATPHDLFYKDLTDNTLNRISKVNGLSDVGVSAIAYNAAQKTLVVAYTNANVDLITDDEVTNIADIKRSNIPGNKTINRIKCDSNFAYLACGFGVVVIDLKRREVKDTWLVGDLGTYKKINDIEFFNHNICLATESGVMYADKSSPNLANYQMWNTDTSGYLINKSIMDLEDFGSKMIAHVPQGDSSYLYLNNGSSWFPTTLFSIGKKNSIVSSYQKLAITFASGNVIAFDTNFNQTRNLFTYNPGAVYPAYASFDRMGDLWICDNEEGLIWNNGSNAWDCRRQTIMGPTLSDIWKVFGNDKNMVIIGGGVNAAYNNLWNRKPICTFVDEEWNTLNRWNNPAIDTLNDIINGVVDPLNGQSVWLSSWGKGLVHVLNNQITEVFDCYNSGLERTNDATYLHGLCFDKEHNLWMINSNTSKVLKVKTADNQWLQFSLSPYSNGLTISSLAIDSSGYKWILLPRNNGIIVYNDNGTLNDASDDQVKSLNINLGTRVSSSAINCFTEDLNGDMWVGTDKGIKVFYSASSIFSEANPAPQTILIDQDGYVQNLLEFENVTAIAVDGANRKWIGTTKAGLFMVSSDGTTELAHFTTINSPLFSDEITSLSINQKTGELFIGTASGLISYRIDATMGTDKIEESEVFAFPNPVAPDYNGVIAIKGLTTNANIKITNINGALVYQTIANGGEAIWNGKNFSDEKVASGVYFVLSSDEDGSQKVVTKILFIN